MDTEKLPDIGKVQEENTAGAMPATESDNTVLGEKGLKALQEEREARKTAEKRITALETALQAQKDKGKSLEERNSERIAQLEADVKAEKYANRVMQAAAHAGVPVGLMTGAADDPEAFAKALVDWKNSASAESKSTNGESIPSIKQRPEGKGAVSIDEQIATAEKAGDVKLVSVLKAVKLGTQ